jgi:targeting protein for Xklp2
MYAHSVSKIGIKKPFEGNKRRSIANSKKKNKIKEFRANPVPNFTKSGLPKKKPAEVTDLAPFNLQSEERGALYRQNWKSKLETEMKDLEENRKFHAKPPSVIYKEPFRPDYSGKALVEPIEPNLHSDKRALEREKYDEELRRKQEVEEMHRREMEILQAERDREEEIERRRQLVHKALPLKITPPFQVKSSDKPLTEPQSPAFTRLPSERRLFK